MVKIQKLLILVTTLMVLLVFFSGCNETQTSKSKTLYVDDEPGKDFVSIQVAIDAANPGWTIFVYDGFYNEALFIDKPVKLIGLNPEKTFILPKDVKSNNNCTIFINANNCTIKNFDISFEGVKSENIGIRISSSNNTILNNTFSNFKYAVYFSSDDTLFNNNISYNRITDCTYGLYGQSDLKFNVFFNNSIKNNNNGFEFYSIVNSTITGNNVSFNSMYGIHLAGDSDGNIISYNYLKDNHYGIRVKGVSFNEIFANILVENNIGLYPCCGAKNNKFYYNSLINNTKQAADSFTNFWDNGKYGNYWSDYTQRYPNASSINGVWDTPYNIPEGNNKDNFPLVNPFV